LGYNNTRVLSRTKNYFLVLGDSTKLNFLMKKIFLLATFLLVGVASAQEVPTITNAQLE
jgi:hypothetical protein